MLGLPENACNGQTLSCLSAALVVKKLNKFFYSNGTKLIFLLRLNQK